LVGRLHALGPTLSHRTHQTPPQPGRGLRSGQALGAFDRGGRDSVDSDSGRTPFEREDRRGRLTQPVLFVHGTCDRLVPVAAGCRAAPDNPSMETVVLDWVGHTVAVECVLVRRSGGVPLRGLGFGLAASGSAGAGSYRSSVGAGCCGADAMACTNQRCGWPGNRWGRGPNWATTGVIRPVTEISGRVDVAVHDFTCERAHQVFVDSAFADQARWGAVRCGAAVVDLAGGKPAIRHGQVAAVAGSLVRPVAAQPIPSQHPRWPGETIAGPCSVSWRPRRDPRSRCGRRRPPARW